MLLKRHIGGVQVGEKVIFLFGSVGKNNNRIVLDFLAVSYIIRVNKQVGFSAETMPALFPCFYTYICIRNIIPCTVYGQYNK